MVSQMEEEVDQNYQATSEDQKGENEASSSVEIEENVLKFLDSVDSYLILMNSLSSTLRQGWLELASARHSMGVSRVNSTLFDLKDHSAATTFQVNCQCVDSAVEQPIFKLHKWASSDSSKSMSGEETFEEEGILLPSKSNRPPIGNSDMQEKGAGNNGSPVIVHNQVQKERLKRLSVFGALFSPKLRAAQLSFETALEILAEIANMRSSLLAAYEQVRKETESTTK